MRSPSAHSATQSRDPQDSLDSHLVDLEMKLQMVSEEIAASLEEQNATSSDCETTPRRFALFGRRRNPPEAQEGAFLDFLFIIYLYIYTQMLGVWNSIVGSPRQQPIRILVKVKRTEFPSIHLNGNLKDNSCVFIVT